MRHLTFNHLNSFQLGKGLRCVTLGAFLLFGSVTVFAQSTETPQFGSEAGQKVLKAQTLAETGQYRPAVEILDQALTISDLSPYEISSIHMIAGQYQFELGRLDKAILAMERALQVGGLPAAETRTVEMQIARLLIASERYAEGAERLENWVRKTDDQDPKNVEYIMQAWVQAERFDQALPWAEKWFAGLAAKERRDYDLMNFIYYNLDRQDRQIELVKEMINRWPEDTDLWNNWISLLAANGQEKQAFEVKNVMYQWGMLESEDDIKKIVEYHQYYEMPFQAARILEDEMGKGRVQTNTNNLVRLSELFRQAREYERALPILKQAAEASGRAKSWAVYGEALYHEGHCEEAETALKSAIDKGYDRGKSWMLISNCWYERGQEQPRPDCHGKEIKNASEDPKLLLNRQALSGFRKVPVTSKEYKAAQKWVDYVTTENASYAKRCQEIWGIGVDDCMFRIQSADKTQIFRREFRLNTKYEHCEAHIPEYEKRYGKIKSLE